jgi:hypothetical protein
MPGIVLFSIFAGESEEEEHDDQEEDEKAAKGKLITHSRVHFVSE